jgi:signal transduction histidine kinase
VTEHLSAPATLAVCGASPALRAGRLARLAATPDVHRGLPADLDGWAIEQGPGPVGIAMTLQTFADPSIELAQLRKETFVSTLAHELRQPLSAMLAAVDVVRRAPDPDTLRQVTDVMLRQLGQMSRVVEDLVDAARWARGKVNLRRRRVDLRDVMHDAAEDAIAAVAASSLTLVVVNPSEPLWANADPQRLLQVLSNLLRNAVKYTEPGGRISLAAEGIGSTIYVRVNDTGRGIEPDALAHIFDLFSQVRPGEAFGLGIGLSVAREIVALHGGQIDARSEGPGHGSEFIVMLPRAQHSVTAR